MSQWGGRADAETCRLGLTTYRTVNRQCACMVSFVAQKIWPRTDINSPFDLDHDFIEQ